MNAKEVLRLLYGTYTADYSFDLAEDIAVTISREIISKASAKDAQGELLAIIKAQVLRKVKSVGKERMNGQLAQRMAEEISGIFELVPVSREEQHKIWKETGEIDLLSFQIVPKGLLNTSALGLHDTLKTVEQVYNKLPGTSGNLRNRLESLPAPQGADQQQSLEQENGGDAAMKGGIDFNATHFDLQIKRDGHGIPLPWSKQDMAQLSTIQGFDAQITEIKPADNFPILKELQQKIRF